MPNKTRYIISADRNYVIKLENGTEIEVSGLDLVDICTKIVKLKKFVKDFNNIDKDLSNEKS